MNNKLKSESTIFFQPYDCLLLVHPIIQILEKRRIEIQSQGFDYLNIGKELSRALLVLSASERSRFSQKWFIDTISNFQDNPILFTNPDLLFEPSLSIDPLALFRQAARIRKLLVLWPGDFSSNVLSYATPQHQHYRTWQISEYMLQQPALIIHRIFTSEGD